MLIVIALGGNALLQPNEPLTAQNLTQNCKIAAAQIASIAKKHQIVLVHGNGPQIGLLSLQAEAYTALPSYPFDILGAESQGMIGYVLQQALKNALPTKDIATILTQVLVNIRDPALQLPSKPIGPFYDQVPRSDWQFQKTSQGFRRLIASPQPKTIIELPSIQKLIEQNHIVIAGGGGGIPCVRQKGNIVGIEAVIDKDLTASLLACSLNADRFIILTNVDGVYENWGSQKPKRIQVISLKQISKMFFEAGSMQPKIKAACQFISATNRDVSIGHLAELGLILKKKSGTHISDF